MSLASAGFLRALVLTLACALPFGVGAAESIRIGSKVFTENVILGEIVRQLLSAEGVPAAHRAQLGESRVLWLALLRGELDIYPEYTGTLLQEILVQERIRDFAGLEAALATRAIGITAPLGFNNTYVIGMTEARARSLAVRSIADLRAHPDLVFGFESEFMQRNDGWPSLRARYGLPQTDVRGLAHELAYVGLDHGKFDAINLYSTDAEITQLNLRLLEDDLGHFPDYLAVYLYRRDALTRFPALGAQLARLAGSIDNATMARLNAQARIERQSEQQVAAGFLQGRFGMRLATDERGIWDRFVTTTRQHLALVLASLVAAILIGVPLGVLAAKSTGLAHLILGCASIVQTLPALALFVFMIPILGIGTAPTVAVLFLYSLLPIVRNTFSGLEDIPGSIRESAAAIGLPAWATLRQVELPLATRSILAGVKTSAVINVGTATLGAIIGAGGYGQPIMTGIRLDDTQLILEGAVPAAALALLVQGAFELWERVLLPRSLRHR